MNSNPLHIVFMGTPEFAVPVLSILHQSKICIIDAVVSMPARPAGRGKELTNPPVAQFAKNVSIPCFQVENLNRDESFQKFMLTNKTDLVIVLAFAQFLGQKVLAWPRFGCFNIHTSILPRYRGASPIHHALLNGDLVTGSCIQLMVKELDAGDIFLERETTIGPDENYSSLSQKLNILNQELVKLFIEKLQQDGLNSFNRRQQNVNFISTAREIEKSQGVILFKKMSASEIYHKLNAFKNWPGINFKCISGTIKIHNLKITQEKLEPGTVKIVDNVLRVGTSTFAIDLLELQPENKKSMSSKDYINGKKGLIPGFIEEL